MKPMTPEQAMARLAHLSVNVGHVSRGKLLERLGDAVEMGLFLARRNRELHEAVTPLQERCTALIEETRRLKAENAGLAMRACTAERERDLLRDSKMGEDR